MIDSLGLPLACKISRKLFKKQFIENFSLNINERKVLSDHVESITLEYLLNKDKINILPFVDEERDYSEIAFVQVEITDKSKFKPVASIIQNIPYPIILFIVFENFFMLNISPKRINKGDSSKLVVEESHFTDWIDLENPSQLETAFIESLGAKNHPFTDLYAFYNSYLDKLIAFNASKHSGTLSVNEDTKAILEEITTHEAKIIEFKNKIKKETNFNDKVNLNIELKKVNDRLNTLKGKL
ncbi:MAG: DUF4391 domain-containing protein [Sulfuricurvum sp.]|nr:DUF4391 domain-containing protein [Sulfuricurvum sp.]